MSNLGWEKTLSAAPAKTAARAAAEARLSRAPRADRARASKKEVSGSSPRTVSEKEACSRPREQLRSRKPSVYASDTRATSRNAAGGRRPGPPRPRRWLRLTSRIGRW